MNKNNHEIKDLCSNNFRNELYPDDQKYRKHLAERINVNPDCLMSIIGPDEFCSMLPTFSYENYNPGTKFENLKDGTFRVNLHIHTTESDGQMTVENLLEQAVDYSEKLLEPPFLVAITNHDSVEDGKKATKIIAEDPFKYRNIRVVLGIELSGKYYNKEFLNAPVKYELIGYCINPFDEILNNHLIEFTNSNKEFTHLFIEKLNKIGLKTTYEEAKDYHNLINIGSSAGLLFILKEFLLLKAEEQGFKKKLVYNAFNEHENKIGHKYLTGNSPDLEELFNIVNSGILGIAHPGRIYIESPKKGVSTYDALSAFIRHFRDLGGLAAEVNYLYPNDYFNHGFREYLKKINKISSELSLLQTGGIDNHGPNIFIRN